jgi:hypothetical protein
MHVELNFPYEKPECRFQPPSEQELQAIKAETGIEIDPDETRDRKFIGEEIFTVYYRKVVQAYDPQRFYHPNSPYGGERANDPHVGDVHPWSFYHVDMDYPVLSSEGVVGGTPPLKSLRKWLGDELWPKEGWVCLKRNAQDKPLPPSWARIAKDYYFFTRSRGMFDADSPESLAYMLDTAIALREKETIERFRRGRPSTQPYGGRKCSGILVWRLNASWPQIAWNNVDYELEPNATYYYTRRAFEPFLLSFDTTNGIYLWAVNDTPRYVEGKVVFKLFNPGANAAPVEIEKEVVVPAGESRIVMDLRHITQISRQHVLYACMVDGAGNVLARQYHYLAAEQHRHFPAARLRIEQRGDGLVITADRYARSVELTGDDAGDEFGWLFEDNYFDLIPGENKTVKVMGRHRTGTIRAKPYYSPHVATVQYNSSQAPLRNPEETKP